MPVVGISDGLNESAGTTVSVTRSVTNGNYLLALAFGDVLSLGSDTSITFSTTSGSTSAWTEDGTVDQYNVTDGFTQEAAYATASATGSVTVTATFGASITARWIALVELSGESGFDTSAYARDTAGPWASASLSNTNADATRVIIGIFYGGGTGSAQSPYTDQGALFSASGFGAFGRVQSIEETSVNSRTGEFATGTGVSPAHISQFIFNDSGGSPPTITDQPDDVTGYSGGTVQFTVAATGGTLTYQWQRSTDGGATYSNVSGGSGGTSATYTTPTLGFTENGYFYRCQVTDSNGTTDSNGARLTLIPASPISWLRA